MIKKKYRACIMAAFWTHNAQLISSGERDYFQKMKSDEILIRHVADLAHVDFSGNDAQAVYREAFEALNSKELIEAAEKKSKFMGLGPIIERSAYAEFSSRVLKVL